MKYFTILLLVLVASPLSAQTPGCQPSYSMVDLDVNNIRAKILGAGALWWNYSDARYEVPKGSGVHSLFAGGLWIGGIDAGGTLRLAAQTYSQTGVDFWPGPIINGSTTSNACQAWDRHWKVDITDIDEQKDNFSTFGSAIPVAKIPVTILQWPAKGNPYAKGKYNTAIQVNDDYAPFVDVNSDGIYNPVHGDYPNIKGDQMIWWIFNDIGNVHSESGSDPIGLEVHATAYAFYGGNTPLFNTTFYNYTFVNKGSHTVDSMYAGQWVDVDLGYPFDDFVTYDSARNMIVGRNGDDSDGPAALSYGSNPPAMAFKLLRGPEHKGQYQPIAYATSYDNDFGLFGNPVAADQFYYYLTGRVLNGEPWSNYGSSSHFLGFDSCSTPFDRRFLASSGPFQMAPGDRKSMDFAMIWVRQGDLAGCTTDFWYLNTAAGMVQATFDSQIAADIAEKPSVEIAVYPNPAEDQVMVRLPGQRSEITLYSLNGQVMYREVTDQQKVVLSRGSLVSGVYVMEVKCDNEMFRKKVIFK